MKKLLFSFLGMLFYINIFAQAPEPCDDPDKGITVTPTVPLAYIPGTFTDDIWATPDIIYDRPVYFIHGLGGQGDDDGSIGISWSQASLWSEENYYINARRPDYADVSLDFAAAELKGDLELYGEFDPNAFIIAHSQGGIVSRRVDQMIATNELGFEPRTFYGLVTFGTPHQGAMILNNRDALLEWVGTTCDKLIDGPVTEAVESSFFLDLALSPASMDIFRTQFCDMLEFNISPYLFKDYFSGITESYSVGSPQLEELNEFLTEIPYVCFYGIETEPIFWNTITHVVPGHEPNNVTTYGEEPFGAGNDVTMVEFADAMTAKYYSKYYAYDYLADMYSDLIYGIDLTTITCYMTIFCAFGAKNSYNECTEISAAYHNGFDWFIHANEVWEGLIGAGSLQPESETCYCIDWGPLGDVNDDTYDIVPGGTCYTDDANTDCTTTTNYAWVVKANDGVVLAESAANCNGNIPPDLGYSRAMPGSNHFSMRNDFNTKVKLMELFGGAHGEFFRTNLR